MDIEGLQKLFATKEVHKQPALQGKRKAGEGKKLGRKERVLNNVVSNTELEGALKRSSAIDDIFVGATNSLPSKSHRVRVSAVLIHRCYNELDSFSVSRIVELTGVSKGHAQDMMVVLELCNINILRYLNSIGNLLCKSTYRHQKSDSLASKRENDEVYLYTCMYRNKRSEEPIDESLFPRAHLGLGRRSPTTTSSLSRLTKAAS